MSACVALYASLLLSRGRRNLNNRCSLELGKRCEEKKRHDVRFTNKIVIKNDFHMVLEYAVSTTALVHLMRLLRPVPLACTHATSRHYEGFGGFIPTLKLIICKMLLRS
jgi:hypothetical protein